MAQVTFRRVPRSPPVPKVNTSLWSLYRSSDTPRVVIFSDRREDAALGGHQACKLTSAGLSPHALVAVRVRQAGYPRMGLRELATSLQLLAVWARELPHTTVLDVGKMDLVSGTLSSHIYQQAVVDVIRALETSIRDLLSIE